MKDNIIIEYIDFNEEIYEKSLKENNFEEDNLHGIGENNNGNS